ncbi:MAG: low molecular weight protein-tyrosine-phosphatase [Longimicrobiales bacterium]
MGKTRHKNGLGVLFVCLGNICRSPLAEAIFRDLVHKAGLDQHFSIDSAGTSGYHNGDGPDQRTVETARKRGVVVEGTSRQVTRKDLEKFEYVLAMDRDNLTKLRMLDPGQRANIRLLRSFDPEAWAEAAVPDPYYGGPRGFENVHELLERACGGLLEHIRAERGI